MMMLWFLVGAFLGLLSVAVGFALIVWVSELRKRR
jgi:hypothetical protein